MKNEPQPRPTPAKPWVDVDDPRRRPRDGQPVLITNFDKPINAPWRFSSPCLVRYRAGDPGFPGNFVDDVGHSYHATHWCPLPGINPLTNAVLDDMRRKSTAEAAKHDKREKRRQARNNEIVEATAATRPFSFEQARRDSLNGDFPGDKAKAEISTLTDRMRDFIEVAAAGAKLFGHRHNTPPRAVLPDGRPVAVHRRTFDALRRRGLLEVDVTATVLDVPEYCLSFDGREVARALGFDISQARIVPPATCGPDRVGRAFIGDLLERG